MFGSVNACMHWFVPYMSANVDLLCGVNGAVKRLINIYNCFTAVNRFQAKQFYGQPSSKQKTKLKKPTIEF